MKTILVTGGNGFIGRNLCRRLSKDNIVISFDNLFSSESGNLKKDEASQIIYGNVCDYPTLRGIFESNHIDEIYHLACPASPRYYQDDPIYTLDTCYIGSKNLLELAQMYNCKILLSSTSEVYGDPLVSSQSESYRGNVSCNGIRSCYDEGKRVAESLFMNYYRERGVNIRIIRIFNTYGPYMNENDGRVISNFITQAIKNIDITIYGDGTQTRSFQYIDDLIDGMIEVMKNEYHEPINLGNPCEISITELTNIIIRLTNSNSRVVYRDLPEDDPTHRRPDIRLASILLDWSPRVSLEDGLKKTIEYFRVS